MAKERVQRRLAAILAADVAGYSRLMGEDEESTLATLTAHRTELIEPCIAEYRGRLVSTAGDGLLAEFASVVDAVNCAVAFQKGVAVRNAGTPDERCIKFRIGINIGDVIIQDNDVYGDGVNVAARLEGLAEPGGICISGNVREHLTGTGEFDMEDLGAHKVKNIAQPINVWRILLERPSVERLPRISASDQNVRFCSAYDGVRIAYATVGQGTALVRAGNWLSHLELDWQVPTRRELIELLAQQYTVVRYDARGNGLSDCEVENISFEAFVGDLEAVIDDLGLESVSLFGQSQGAAVAAAFAARHPEKVKCLVLLGGYARGRRKRGTPGQIAESDAFVTLIREGWGKHNPAYVQMFGSFFMPDADPDQLAAFTNLQRLTTSAENAARIRFACDDIDITGELDKITAPTLALHAREDAMVPFDEGRRMAASIRGARFVQLESRNHALLPNEPAWKRFLDEVQKFLAS